MYSFLFIFHSHYIGGCFESCMIFDHILHNHMHIGLLTGLHDVINHVLPIKKEWGAMDSFLWLIC